MRLNESSRTVLAVMILLTAASFTACTRSNEGVKSASAASDGGKIPITTKSDEARKEFLQGRDLSEKLLIHDSLQHFDKAISLDPEFASAELARANASPTAKEFFDHQKKAVGLAEKASEGEKLLILANEAGTNGVPAKQQEYLEKLVATYPNDERGHFNLGGFYFGQQEMDKAVEQYKKATEIAPNYSAAYNILGYAYRQQGDYANAEQAFRRYIELIPNDPNPYDSYAELLLKMGRFDDSITQYRKALSIDPHFVPSHFGISADLMYEGKPDAATAELQQMAGQARNDGELRNAHFGMAVVAADSGKLEKALQEVDAQYAIAEKKNDLPSMAGDLQAKGNILLAMHKYDEAAKQFQRSPQLIESANVSPAVKDNAKLFLHFNLTGVALGRKDLTTAKSEAAEFGKGAEASQNPAQIKQAHELAGSIALAEKNYDQAIAELQQANLQNPRNLYRLSQAYQGKNDRGKAQEYAAKAAAFNSLPQLNYALIRLDAKKLAGKKA
jgi:tetratricopeptide (TPR) repeat protein